MTQENQTENQNKGKVIEGLRTFASDIASEVAEKKGGIIKDAVAEEKRILDQKKILSPKSAQNIIYIILSVIFIIIGFIFFIWPLIK